MRGAGGCRGRYGANAVAGRRTAQHQQRPAPSLPSACISGVHCTAPAFTAQPTHLRRVGGQAQPFAEAGGQRHRQLAEAGDAIQVSHLLQLKKQTLGTSAGKRPGYLASAGQKAVWHLSQHAVRLQLSEVKICATEAHTQNLYISSRAVNSTHGSPS